MAKKITQIIIILLIITFLTTSFSACCNLANLGSRDSSEKPGGLLNIGLYIAPDGTAYRFNFYTAEFGQFDKSRQMLEVTDYFFYTIKGNELITYPLSLSPVYTIDWSPYQTYKTKGSPIRSIGEYEPHEGTYETIYASENERSEYSNIMFFNWEMVFNAKSEELPAPSFVPSPIERDTGPKVPNSLITRDMYYARSTLSDNEKAVYDLIYDTIFAMKSETPNISNYGINEGRVSDIVKFIYHDAPELFWWNGSRIVYSSGQTATSVNFRQTDSSTYVYTESEKEQIQDSIDTAVAEIFKNVNEQMSEYEKVRYIYNELGKLIIYDQEEADAISSGMGSEDKYSQSIVGGLVKSKAVCAGITRSMQYLLYNIGINNYYVSGTGFDILGGGEPGPHGWNLILIDGDWYYMDLTTNLDTVKTGQLKGFLKTEEEVSYFCSFISLGDLYDETDDKNENPPLPVCDSERFDYYAIEGVVFDNFNSSALNSIKNYLADALLNGKNQVELIFTSSDAAKEAEKVFNGSDTVGQYPTARQIAADIPPKNGLGIFTTSVSLYEYNSDYIELTIYLLYQKVD